MNRPGYVMVKEAAVRYGVSRAKLHRLIQLGRLKTFKDPRDERVTLVCIQEVEAVFRFPDEEVVDMGNQVGTGSTERSSGRLTQGKRDRIDALRRHISAGKWLPQDSVEIIREQRERRTQEFYNAGFSNGEKGETIRPEA